MPVDGMEYEVADFFSHSCLRTVADGVFSWGEGDSGGWVRTHSLGEEIPQCSVVGTKRRRTQAPLRQYLRYLPNY